MNLQCIQELWVNSQEGEGDVGRSAAVIFGVPTCVGNMSWRVKKRLGTNWNVQVGGKLDSAFATENSPNGGGAELAVPTPVNRMRSEKCAAIPAALNLEDLLSISGRR